MDPQNTLPTTPPAAAAQPPAGSEPNRRNLFILAFVVLVIIALGGWYAWHKKQNNQAEKAATAVPAGWTTYKDAARGFQFNYPQNWGKAEVKEIPGQVGKSYTINLPIPKKEGVSYRDSLGFSMDSDNAVHKNCLTNKPTDCTSTKSFTSKDIDSSLVAIKNGTAKKSGVFFKYDSESFVVLKPGSGPLVGGLMGYRIIDLPKIQVTAVRAEYDRSGNPTSCPVDRLEISSQPGCLVESDYQTLNKILKSIKAI